MIRWEHRYLLGTMVSTVAGDVVRDFDGRIRGVELVGTGGLGVGCY